MIKADLHNHGAIGYQEYWLKKQGYSGKNLLKLIADKCFEKDISICAITSEELEIPQGSVHDRLNFLIRFSKDLPRGYHKGKLGDNIFAIEKNGQQVFLINSQTVLVQDEGKRLDHLVVGSDQIPNGMNLTDTLQYGEDHGLIQIAEHPLLGSHYSIGKQRLLTNKDRYTAVEGHNSQLLMRKKANKESQNLAVIHKIPWIAVSDAHRVEDIGLGYIELINKPDCSNEQKFLKTLKDKILDHEFTPIADNYISLFGSLNWNLIFLKGLISRILFRIEI